MLLSIWTLMLLRFPQGARTILPSTRRGLHSGFVRTNAFDDTLGDHVKSQEEVECGRRADRYQPLMARLDGKAFHTFTKGLKTPYDQRLSQLMIDTTAYLIQETDAKLGYTQSDEISLYFVLDLNKDPGAQYMYNGRFQKIASVLASMASAYFNRELPQRIPEKTAALPAFDCRVWNVENMREVYLNFLWRQNDAVRNSILMLGQASFTHTDLHGKDCRAIHEMLRSKGKVWDAEPAFFKWGSFVGRTQRTVQMSQAQLDRCPPQHRPTGPVVRMAVRDLELGRLKDMPDETFRSLFGFSRGMPDEEAEADEPGGALS